MKNELVGVRISPELKTKAEHITKEYGFSNTQEFIREAIRARIEKYERQEAIKQLQQLAGTQTAKKASKQELANLAKKLYG